MHSIILGIKLIQRNSLFSVSLIAIFSAFCAATLFLIYPYWAAFVTEPVGNYKSIAHFYTKGGVTYTQQSYYLANQQSFESVSRLLPGQIILPNGKELDLIKIDPEFFTIFNKQTADSGTLFHSTDNRELARNHIVISDSLFKELNSADSLSKKDGDSYIESETGLYEIVGIVENFEFPTRNNAWALITNRDLNYSQSINISFIGVLKQGRDLKDAQHEFDQLVSEFKNDGIETGVKFSTFSDYSHVGFEIDLTIIKALLVCLLISGMASIVGSLFSHLLKMDKGWKISHLIGLHPIKIIAGPLVFVLLILILGAIISLFWFSIGYPLIEKYQIVKSETAPFWWELTPTVLSNIKFASLLTITTTAAIAILLLSHLYNRYTARFTNKIGRNNNRWFENLYWLLLGMQIVVTIWIVFFIVVCLLAYRNEVVVNRGFNQEGKVVLELAKRTKIGVQEVPQKVKSILGLNENDFCVVNTVPGAGGFPALSSFRIDNEASDANPLAILEVSKSFFKILEIEIIAGRSFNDFDQSGSEPVIIIDRDTAIALGGEQQALGRTITLNPTTPFISKTHRIIGVANNISSNSYNLKTAYIPVGQGLANGKELKIILQQGNPLSFEAIASLTSGNQSIFLEPYYYSEVIKKSGAPYLARVLSFLPSALLMVTMLFLSINAITSKILQSKNKNIAVMLSIGCKKQWIVLSILKKYLITFFLGATLAYVSVYYSDATIWMVYVSNSGNIANAIFCSITFVLFVAQTLFIITPIYKKVGVPVSILLKNNN